MICPSCLVKGLESPLHVIRTVTTERNGVRRTRECPTCSIRYTSLEKLIGETTKGKRIHFKAAILDPIVEDIRKLLEERLV